MSDAGSPSASPTGSWPLDQARAAAVRTIERLGREDDAIRLSVAGSVRRMAPLHDAVDLVATAYDPARLRNAFEEIRSGDGIPVRLEVVTEERFAATMIRATGPDAHVEALRALGLDLNRAEGSDEAALYESVGLDFVPPERREASGFEVEPALVAMPDIRGVVGLRAADRETAEALVSRAAQEGYAWVVLDDAQVGAAMADYLPEGFRVIPGAYGAVGEARPFWIAEVQGATTERIRCVLDLPHVDALAFPLDAPVDVEEVLNACMERRVAVAWSGDPQRLTLDLAWHEAARARGLKGLPLADASSPDDIDQALFAVGQARRGGWRKDEILTTFDAAAFEAWVQGRREP